MIDASLFHTFSFFAIFIASMAGSLHCVGMCGGMVAVAGGSSRGQVMGQIAYNMGRGVCYAFLGVLAGAFGEAFLSKISTLLVPIGAIGPIVSVLCLLGICGITFVVLGRRQRGLVTLSRPSFVTKLQDRLAAIPFTLGISSGLLPCPWLYSFVLLAAAGGSAAIGLKVMVAFWFGTLPALFLVGTIFEASLRELLRRHPYVSIVSMVGALMLSLAAHLSHLAW